MDKHKGLAALLIGPADHDGEEGDEGDGDTYDMAAHDVMQAMKEDDPEAFKSALKACIHACLKAEEGEESEGDEY